MQNHEKYMHRCLELAALGLGRTAPNPLVGCVVVADKKIIGEGYHQAYGGHHAEVNAIHSVASQDMLEKATLYVNLEPCSHWGKTPPCSDLIIEKKIPRVVIGSVDINSAVNGKGIEKLRKAGIEVEVGILEKESLELNRRFFTFHQMKRPYILLKWALTADGFIARENYDSKWISNPISRLLVHKWRSEEAGIITGTRTANYDNPRLNARDMSTVNPVRIVLDKNLTIPSTHHIFDGSQKTIVFTAMAHENKPDLEYITLDFGNPEFLKTLLEAVYQKGISSIMVEGGAILLSSFIEKGLWDEARVFQSRDIYFGKGIKGPAFPVPADEKFDIKGDILGISRNLHPLA